MNSLASFSRFGDLADSMVLVFKRYNYAHFCVLRDDSQTYFSLLAKAIVFKITQDDTSLGSKYSELALNSLTAVKEDYVRLLNDAAGRARGQCMTFACSFVRVFHFQSSL